MMAPRLRQFLRRADRRPTASPRSGRSRGSGSLADAVRSRNPRLGANPNSDLRGSNILFARGAYQLSPSLP